MEESGCEFINPSRTKHVPVPKQRQQRCARANDGCAYAGISEKGLNSS